MNELKPFFSVAQALSMLLPNAEVVIHNLVTGKIAAIYNNFSKRRVGEDSLLEELADLNKLPDCFETYTKANWNGRRLKSTTATLRDKKGNPIGLFCINLDVSAFEEMKSVIDNFLEAGKKQPKVLFKDDFKEKINQFITTFLRKEGVTIKTLTKEEKQNLILLLHKEGAFEAKNSANYIASVLDLSRATVYNYLRQS